MACLIVAMSWKWRACCASRRAAGCRCACRRSSSSRSAPAAAEIARVVDNNMATAARVHIAESGTDPLRYRMVAFGGAGPVHAYEIARLLGVREVIFPRGAGVASAVGMLVAPRSVEYTRSLIMRIDGLDWGLVDAAIAELEAR